MKYSLFHRFSALLICLASSAMLSAATFTATGSLSQERADHTATLLSTGKILVVGGGSYSASSEFYDPAKGT